MKIKYILIVISILNINCCRITPQETNTTKHSQSKMLIDRYNILRTEKKLPIIIQDTILDSICKILITNNQYKNRNNIFNEDSVRQLLYRNNIIDYQYEIKEISVSDTANTYNSFLISDKSNNIRLGYAKNKNKHILLKTKNYLKFERWKISVSSGSIDGFSPTTIVNVKTDSIIGYFKTSTSDIYYYQFYSRIPLSTDKLDNIKRFEVQPIKIEDKDQDSYELIIKFTDPDVFLIILNKDYERIAILK